MMFPFRYSLLEQRGDYTTNTVDEKPAEQAGIAWQVNALK
jgi:hypothetical protein